MARRPQPPLAVVVSFIDCINRGDVEGLGELMTDDHRLLVLDEAPLVGKEANVAAWHGYASAFSDYVIYPERIADRDGRVAVLGRTTGSHLGLPDDEELQLTVVWCGEVTSSGLVSSWEILEDSPTLRAELGLD